MTYDIKNMVKDGRKATFVEYRHKELWYVTECGFKFPVPIDDIGDATFLSVDKALLLMRYIRQHIADIEAGRVA